MIPPPLSTVPLPVPPVLDPVPPVLPALPVPPVTGADPEDDDPPRSGRVKRHLRQIVSVCGPDRGARGRA